MNSLNIEEIKNKLISKVPDFAKKVAPADKLLWTVNTPDEKGIASTLYSLIDGIHEIDLYTDDIPCLRITSRRLTVGYEVLKTSKNGFITGIETFIEFKYSDNSFDDFKNYLIEWKKI